MEFNQEGHILISPKEFQEQAFSNPSALIDHVLLPGTPLGFLTYNLITDFVDYLSKQTGIHPHHFLFRGSTKIGYSISPSRKIKKTWRQFSCESDIDLAIIDPLFFATLDEEVRRWDRQKKNKKNVFQYKTEYQFEKYQDRIKQKGWHDCYRFFDLPPKLDCMRELKKVLRNAPIKKCCVHPFNKFEAFIFRDRWALHQRYLTDINDLRKGLNAEEDTLPQAPETPFLPE